ncbi:ABC transporter ATP-binding protein [Haladaptatus sp.]|uniref:ABC transporter ATP-binding protein n=1 Tax=Haladaptatus sp. TaxID=1973141 RepID=UPI003C679056
MQGTAERADPIDPILSVENLRTTYYTDKEEIHAVDGVDFHVNRGETLGIVGESGSGKSVTARSVLGLVDEPGVIEAGSSITFDGEELTEKTEREMERIRGGRIAMVFQDPLNSLNPVYTVGNQIREALQLHRGISGSTAKEKAIELLEDVGIPDATRRVDEFPHQFSGGMRQRAVIAMGLACDPDLLICDEPTTALDVTIQAQIIEYLEEIQARRGLSIIFITHDMGVIAEVADRVAVMYAGKIAESAPVSELFANASHPYTEGLLASIPGNNVGRDRLATIEGDVPTPTSTATSCRFSPRCPKAFDDCRTVHPKLVPVRDGVTDHTAACLLYPDDEPRTDAVETHRDHDTATEETER